MTEKVKVEGIEALGIKVALLVAMPIFLALIAIVMLPFGTVYTTGDGKYTITFRET